MNLNEVILNQESGESVTKRRPPTCAKCRNHNLVIKIKGHKGLCKFEDCRCPKCLNIDERREVMKSITRNRRQLEKEEKKKLSNASTTVPSLESYSNVNTLSLPPIQWSFDPIAYNYDIQSYVPEMPQQNWWSLSGGSELHDLYNNSVTHLMYNQNE